jgi:hypothetical protein
MLNNYTKHEEVKRKISLWKKIAGGETEKLENLGQRAKPGKGGLKKVGTHKSSEQKPILAVDLRQKQA